MTLFGHLWKAIFVGDPTWAWRRRIAVSSTAVMLAGVLNSTFWDHDVAHASIVLTNCIAGLSAVMTIYVGGVVTDEHLRRKTEAEGEK